MAKLAAKLSGAEFEKAFREAQAKGEIPPDVEIEKLLAALESRGINRLRLSCARTVKPTNRCAASLAQRTLSRKRRRTMKIVMMGTGSFAEPTFLKLLEGPHPVVGLVTQPDRALGKERGSTRQAGQGMKELALERGIPVLQPESINTPEGVAIARRACSPICSSSPLMGRFSRRTCSRSRRLGGINVHASLLPKYRGAAPINWAIYHGETQSGVTIIRMSIALDAGDMLAQEAVDILPDETAGELEARLGAARRPARSRDRRAS